MGLGFAFWVFALVGFIAFLKKVVIFSLPDLQEIIDKVLTFFEWLRARWAKFWRGQ